MADDRLACCLPVSMAATVSDTDISRLAAICLRAFQNASSMLILVLCPAITTDRFATNDFIPPAPKIHSHPFWRTIAPGFRLYLFLYGGRLGASVFF
jgi:hypothetical protein